ncbi:MAG: serine hydrolase domain-containing protein, partial [Candidatus Hydrogenedens sp.]
MFSKREREIILKCLNNAIKKSAPGSVAYIGKNNEVLFFDSVGKCAILPSEEEMKKDTIFDLASLTKVIATTTSILLLYQQGKIHLDDPVSKYISIPNFNKFSIRHLLTHSSGLVGYEEWYKEIFSFEDILIKLSKTQLLFEPGKKHLYSDFGFMLLAHIVELVDGETFDQFCKKNIFSKLNMNTTFFNVPEEYKNRCAPTEKCPWRNKIIRGEVHDEHAYAIGGVAGHAGLFSTAEDLSRFCRGIMNGHILEKDVIEEMATSRIIPDYPWQVLGWKTDPFWESIEGQLPFRSALGHTGFTGTCMWWDRKSGYYA